jgi:hypothetical protein
MFSHEKGPAMPALSISISATRRLSGARVAATRIRTLPALALRAGVRRRAAAGARLAVRAMRRLARARCTQQLALAAPPQRRTRRTRNH